VSDVQAPSQDDLEGLFSLAELHRRFKRSHHREATKLAYADFYCYNPDSLNAGSGLK
jgi:hypothetical protein